MNIQVPSSEEYYEVVLKVIKDNTYEIGYGISEGWRKASRAHLERMIEFRNPLFNRK